MSATAATSRSNGYHVGRAALEAILDVIYPRHCIGCGEAVDGGRFRWICPACELDLYLVREPSCQTCGYPFFGRVESLRSCVHCQHLDPVFEEGRTLFLHRGVGRHLIAEMKYRGGLYLISDIIGLAARYPGMSRYVSGCEIVPVPLHSRRERERGYNQSREIARRMARCFGGRVSDVLERVRDTESQTRLTRRKRLRNMKKAFAIRPGIDLDSRSTYMLVDDVFTTGATLNACATALRRNGAQRIRVQTLAHG